MKRKDEKRREERREKRPGEKKQQQKLGDLILDGSKLKKDSWYQTSLSSCTLSGIHRLLLSHYLFYTILKKRSQFFGNQRHIKIPQTHHKGNNNYKQLQQATNQKQYKIEEKDKKKRKKRKEIKRNRKRDGCETSISKKYHWTTNFYNCFFINLPFSLLEEEKKEKKKEKRKEKK